MEKVVESFGQSTTDARLYDSARHSTASWYALAKRPLDLLIGILLLVLTSPLQAIIAVLVRIDSPGPALFHQQRIGQAGKPFRIYKFRSMRRDAPAYTYKVRFSDPRVTRIGSWLRRTGLDELPQLWNVVRGDMALIGPRPEMPFIVEQYNEWQHLRHSVRPGMTGWWQVNHRNEVPMHLNVDYDIYYIDNMSLRFDLDIAWRTAKVMFRGLTEAVSGKQETTESSAR